MQVSLFTSNISAGFPSPADDFVEKKLDLNEYLIKHPAATFFVRVRGSSMQGAGIADGDLLVVDRSLKPANDSIVVAFLEGEFTVKRVKIKGKCLCLIPENKRYAPIEVTEDSDFLVWGVVVSVIKTFN